MNAPVQAQPTSSTARREPRVLLVGADTATADLLHACAMQGSPLKILTAADAQQAGTILSGRQPIDLLIVGDELESSRQLALLRQLNQGPRLMQVMVMSSGPDVNFAVEAMRAGACDLLSRPLDLEQTNRSVREALTRQARSKAPLRRVRRLRRLCKKLNQARLDVTRQVDVLCNDLVTAYQELAEQMQHVVQSTEYGALVKHELDLEQALRATLEFLVQKAGPTNAAIYLPATMDEYSLGGYVNYDCPSETADMLLDHMADVIAPRMTECDDVIHMKSNAEMEKWIGDDAMYLANSELLAFGARQDDETLAVVVLFRDQSQPFDRLVFDACASVGPILGEALARIIRIHHRHMPEAFGSEYDEAGGFEPNDEDEFGDGQIPF